MSYVVRKARVEDVHDVAAVHIASWRDAYKDIVDPEFLKNLSSEGRAEKWKSNILENDPNNQLFVLTTNDKVIGFAAAGSDVDNLGYDFEIRAIYIYPDYTRQGGGRVLVKEVIKAFEERNIKSMIIWVFKDNHSSRKFYEKLGGKYFSEKPKTIGDRDYMLCSYVWDDVKLIK